MRLLPECYVCAMRQTLAAASLVSADRRFMHRCMRAAAAIIAEADPEMTPPELGEGIYRAVRELSGSDDPFREQKITQNRVVEALLPWLREKVAGAEDPVEMAVRFSIAGNTVDPGAQERFDLAASVMFAVESEGALAAYPEFRRALDSSRRILFLADNCGEIVFDRVLIETILEASGGDRMITLAVRGGPIINDVTETEAREVGLGALCDIISSGLEMPGTVLEKATEEFREAFHAADMVISKGQGNWETLEDCGREVFFLLQAKCPVVARMNSVEEGRPLLLRTGPAHTTGVRS